MYRYTQPRYGRNKVLSPISSSKRHLSRSEQRLPFLYTVSVPTENLENEPTPDTVGFFQCTCSDYSHTSLYIGITSDGVCGSFHFSVHCNSGGTIVEILSKGNYSWINYSRVVRLIVVILGT